MRAYATRCLATFILVASLLAPFASGWAMALGVADGRILVICSGDGLRTIYVDENGEATQLSDEAVACVLKSATDTAQAIGPAPRAERFLFETGTLYPAHQPGPDAAYLASLPRAPPVI